MITYGVHREYSNETVTKPQNDILYTLSSQQYFRIARKRRHELIKLFFVTGKIARLSDTLDRSKTRVFSNLFEIKSYKTLTSLFLGVSVAR